MSVVYVDFDGTIVDVFPRYYIVLNRFLNNYYGRGIDYQTFYIEKRNGEKEHIIVKKNLKINLDIEAYLQYKKEKLEEKENLKIDRFIGKPFETYQYIKSKGFDVIVLSQRRNKENFEWQLQELKYRMFCDEAICLYPQSQGNAKLAFLEGRAEAGDIIIGDSQIEMECSKKLGISGCFVNTGLFSSVAVGVEKAYNNYDEAVRTKL